MIEIIKNFARPGAVPQDGEVRGRYYVRTGECTLCGKCCTNIHLIHEGEAIADEATFLALQEDFPEYRSFVPVDATEHGLRFRCVHLQADNSCGIYADRPEFCRRYPSETSLLLGGTLSEECGYKFQVRTPFSQVLAKTAEKPARKGRMAAQ